MTPQEQERLGFGTMERGWAIGTAGWRKALAKAYSRTALNPGLERKEIRELKESAWEEVLARELDRTGKSSEHRAVSGLGSDRRIEIASRLREIGVPFGWISERLGFGNVDALRARIYRHRKGRLSQRSP